MTRIFIIAIVVLSAFMNLADAEDISKYRAKVFECLDILIEHGQDTYGKKRTPILVSILDVNTLECPREPKTYDEPWRVIRRHRRNPAGADLATDMQTLSAMNRLGGAYKTFAKEYIKYYMANFISAKQSLVCWGWHEYYDVFADQCVFDQHELHAGLDSIEWALLWETDPVALRRQAENTWKWHVVDKQTGEINRHGDGEKGQRRHRLGDDAGGVETDRKDRERGAPHQSRRDAVRLGRDEHGQRRQCGRQGDPVRRIHSGRGMHRFR